MTLGPAKQDNNNGNKYNNKYHILNFHNVLHGLSPSTKFKQSQVLSIRKFSTLNINKFNVTLCLNENKEIENEALAKKQFFTSCKKNISVTLSCKDSEELTKFIKEKNINPCFIYENLSNNTVRTRILNETRNLSGIYLILNKATLDYYIGSASTGKFFARFSNHLFNYSGSKILKNAVKKYKVSSFAFLILELFPEIVNKENNKKLLDLEDFYLKSLLPNYNILTEAGSSFGYKHTEITRLKMKANYSEERRIAIGNLNRGKTLSSNTIELIRQAALNRTKPIYSTQGIQNMKKKSKAIRLYNLDNTVFGEFSSMTEASIDIGCDQKTIRRALQSKKKILRRR
jgi:group I intron endonuclease